MSMEQRAQIQRLREIYQGVLGGLELDSGLHDRLSQETASPYSQLLAIGKSAARMAETASAYLAPGREGFVLTKEGHLTPRLRDVLWGFETWEAGHPLPDTRGQMATERLLEWLDQVRRPSHLLLLLSGGASSLLVDPAPPLTLEDLKGLNLALLSSGLPIDQINIVRKHLSTLKGGGLGDKLGRFAQVTQLVYSDICPDWERLDLVGSGPALSDPSTLQDASEILDRLAPFLLPRLMRRCREALRETPKQLPWKAERLADYRTLVSLAVQAVGLRKEAPGWSDTVTGDVAELAAGWAHLASRLQAEGFSGVLVASGEPTVRLEGLTPGAKGGRCQELAARFAREISGRPGLALLAGGSDGTDGPTPYAGACVDGESWGRLVTVHGVQAAEALLAGHDVTALLRAVEGLLLDTGPTGHNLNDLFLLSISSS